MFEDVFGAPFVPSKLIKTPFPFGHFWTVSVFEVCCPWLLPFMSLRAKEEDGDTWGWHRTAVSKWCCFSHSLQLILSSQIMCKNRATPCLPKGDTLIFMVNWKELRRDLLLKGLGWQTGGGLFGYESRSFSDVTKQKVRCMPAYPSSMASSQLAKYFKPTSIAANAFSLSCRAVFFMDIVTPILPAQPWESVLEGWWLWGWLDWPDSLDLQGEQNWFRNF